MLKSWTSARAISTRRFMPEDKVRTSLLPPLGQFHQLQQRLDPLPPQLTGNSVDQTMKVQVLVHGQTVVEARILKDHTDVPAGPCGLRDHVEIADAHGTAVRLQDGGQDVQQGGLAGSVGTQQREQLLALDIEGDVRQCDCAAVTLADMIDVGLRRSSRRGRAREVRVLQDARDGAIGGQRGNRLIETAPQERLLPQQNSTDIGRRHRQGTRAPSPTMSLMAASVFRSDQSAGAQTRAAPVVPCSHCPQCRLVG